MRKVVSATIVAAIIISLCQPVLVFAEATKEPALPAGEAALPADVPLETAPETSDSDDSGSEKGVDGGVLPDDTETEEPATDETDGAEEEAASDAPIPPPSGSSSSSDYQPFLDYAADPTSITKALGTYETDLASGAATYSYPLYLPKGRNDLTPQVALSYNSQAGSSDSIVGYGWNLSLGGSISRTKEYGVFEIYDTNEFQLNMNGAGGKLLPVSLEDGEHGEYGLQIEEAFYKYEFQTDGSWLVTDQNGIQYHFGQTTDSRQDDPDDSTRIFEWYLDEIRDPSGNYIRFEYYKEDGRVYPKAVYYTGFGATEAANDGPLEIRFQPFYDGATSERGDFTKWYDKGFEVTTEYLVSGIEVLLDDSLVREYDIAYTTGENDLRSMLESITETGVSFEGDIVTLPATEFEYADSDFSYNYNGSAITSDDLGDAQLMDINGDGYADQAFFDEDPDTHVYAHLNTYDGVLAFSGDEYEADYMAPSASPSYGLADASSSVDMNGDGLPELVGLFHEYEPWIERGCLYYNYGVGLLFNYLYGCDIDSTRNRATLGFRYGDFNGDGLSDVFTGDTGTANWTTSGLGIYLNDSDYYFDDSGYDSPVGFSWGSNISPGFYYGLDTGARLVDINGDGLTDIIQAYQDDNYKWLITDDEATVVKYYLNTGDGSFVESSDYETIIDFRASTDASFVGFASMEYSTLGLTDQTYYSSSNDLCFLDFNNDGVVDVMNNGSIYIWDGVGDSNVATINTSGSADISCGGLDYTTLWDIAKSQNDLNGDGMTDFFESEEGNIYGKDAYLSGSRKPDLLTNISTSGGAEIDILYKSALQYEDSSGNRLNPDLPFAIFTVESVTIDDGFGNESVTTYEYAGGAYYKFFDNYTGEFAGFSEITVNEDGKTTVYYFDTGCHEGEMCSSGLPNEELINIYETTDWYVIDNGYFRDVVENPLDFGLCVDAENCTNAYTTYGTDILDLLPMGEDWDERSDTYMYEIDYSGHALKGKPTMTEIYDDAGNLYARTTNDWSVTELENGRYFPHMDQTVEFAFDGESTAREKAVAYEYNETYGLVMTEINYGEVLADESTYEVGDFMTDDDVYLSKTYASDTSDWIFKVASETLMNASGSTLAVTEYYYDDNETLGDISDGFLTEQKAWLDTDNSWLTTEYDYDEYGNLTTETNPRGYETQIVYDDYHFYPESITNTLSQTIYFEINLITGDPASKTDLNGYMYTYIYDGLGRIIEVNGPSVDGLSTIIHATYSYDDTSFPRTVHESKNDGTSDGLNAYTYVDGLDRAVQTRTEGEDSYIATDTTYTVRSEVESESSLYESSGTAYTTPDTTQPETSYEYDALSRPLFVTTPLGVTQTDYLPWTQTVTDAMGSVKTYYYDAHGNLAQVDETNEGETYSTYYEYNLLGNLTLITDALGNLRNFEWDSLGRLVYQEEMHLLDSTDFATWDYEYDENGNLETQTFPSGEVATYAYDEIDRIENDNSEIFYVYDTAVNGIGLPASIVRGDYSVVYEYNALGQPTVETITINGTSYTTETELDILGRPQTIIYPDASEVSYTYNNAGFEETVSNYVTDIDYSPLGQIENIVYENGSTTVNTYDPEQNYLLTNKVTTGYFSDDPNIYVSSVTLSSSNNIQYTISNDGHSDIDSATVGKNIVYVDGVRYASNTWDRVGDKNFLNMGGSSTLYFKALTTGTHEVEVCVDTTSLVSEYDETDNCLTERLTVGTPPAGSANIRVNSVELTSSNYILYTVENNGSTAISRALNGRHIVYVDGVRHASNSWLYMSDTRFLRPGGTSYLYFAPITTSGEHIVEVCIDTTNVLAESDEADNCLTEILTVGTPPSETPEGTYGNIQSLSYTYDSVGNIIGITDNSITPTYKATVYTYDDLYRLKSATAYTDSTLSTALYALSYDYDPIGNMTYKSDIGDILYENTNPYQASSVAGVSYTYDSVGNLTSDGTYTYTYNYRNEMTESSDGFSYGYDPGGIRYGKINSADSSETVYVNNYYETDSTMGATTYVYAGGLQVANISNNVGGSDFGSNNVTYNHHDHLGGVAVTTDEEAIVKEALDYYPYGGTYIDEQYSSEEAARYTYTGKELDESGLYYFEARYYDAKTGRFVSQDPAVYDGRLLESLIDPQALNSYAYCSNNPLAYVDPTGGSFISFLAGVANAWSSNNLLGAGRVDISNDAAYTFGQAVGDVASIVTGCIETAIGVTTMGGGTTGGLALAPETAGGSIAVGVAISAEGAAITAHGVTTMLSGGKNLGDDIKSKFQGLIKGSTFLDKSGNLTQYGKVGGYDQALKDFEELTGGTYEVSQDGKVFYSTLEDGSTVSVRDFSRGGNSTIQIDKTDGTTVKYRYD